MAHRARAFGLEIAYHNRKRLPEAVERMFQARWVEILDDLMGEADILALHCPAGPRHTPHDRCAADRPDEGRRQPHQHRARRSGRAGGACRRARERQAGWRGPRRSSRRAQCRSTIDPPSQCDDPAAHRQRQLAKAAKKAAQGHRQHSHVGRRHRLAGPGPHRSCPSLTASGAGRHPADCPAAACRGRGTRHRRAELRPWCTRLHRSRGRRPYRRRSSPSGIGAKRRVALSMLVRPARATDR